jgi:hypothetical protein
MRDLPRHPFVARRGAELKRTALAALALLESLASLASLALIAGICRQTLDKPTLEA